MYLYTSIAADYAYVYKNVHNVCRLKWVYTKCVIHVVRRTPIYIYTQALNVSIFFYYRF